MATPIDSDQKERFLREIAPAAAQVCPQYGLDPKQCIMEAAVASSCGRFSLGFNWWNLHGTGDAGFYSCIVPVRTERIQGGGWAAAEQKLAKFRSPFSAVDAWCRAKGGGDVRA